MKLAEMIGVHKRFVTIPGAFGIQENHVPLIYIMIAAVVVRERKRSDAIACVSAVAAAADDDAAVAAFLLFRCDDTGRGIFEGVF